MDIGIEPPGVAGKSKINAQFDANPEPVRNNDSNAEVERKLDGMDTEGTIGCDV